MDAQPGVVTQQLRELADAYGVATQFTDQAGARVEVSAATIVAVLRALEVDASTAEGIARGLQDAALVNWRRMIPPVFITIAGQERRLWVHLPHGQSVTAWLTLEDGSHRSLQQIDHWVDPMQVDGVLTGEASFLVPADLPLGWHSVTASTDHRQATSPLVVTPLRVSTDQIGERQWGVMAQIYAAQSSSSWAIGDLHDAADLATWSAQRGAGFLAINPVHAANVGPPMTPSPYLPTSRRFTNPMYLRVEDIPEYHRLNDQERHRIAALHAQVVGGQRQDGLLDRDLSWQAKSAALELLFARPLS
ncbi:MAG: 4-alpha-glucanotransferase, partial [Actinomycetales bacterium]